MFPHLLSKFRISVISHEAPRYSKAQASVVFTVLGKCMIVVKTLVYIVTAEMPFLTLPFITCVALDKYHNLFVRLSIFISKVGIIRAPASYGHHEV